MIRSIRPPSQERRTMPPAPRAASNKKSGIRVTRMRSRNVMLNSVALPFAVERARVDAKHRSRLIQGRSVRQDPADVLGLELVQRHPAANLDAGLRRRADLNRQVADADS